MLQSWAFTVVSLSELHISRTLYLYCYGYWSQGKIFVWKTSFHETCLDFLFVEFQIFCFQLVEVSYIYYWLAGKDPTKCEVYCACYITKYGSTLYIGMDEVLAHYACIFENSNLHFHF